jgi:hypothetical protein
MDANHERSTAGQRQAGELGLVLESAGSPARAALEQDIAARFAAKHDAQLNQFHPYLLALQNAGRPLAIAGLRPARDGALYLEKYFDSPAEQAVSGVFQTPVDRAQIVEIGNLVSSEPGASYVFFAILAPLLRDAGFRWVICTATAQVEGMLKKMNMAPERICAASPDRLGEEAAIWGRYYDSQPHVIAGDLEKAATLVGHKSNLSALIDHLDGWSAAIGKISQRTTR